MANTLRFNSRGLAEYVPGDWLDIKAETPNLGLPVGTHRFSIVHAIHRHDHWLLRLSSVSATRMISFRVFPDWKRDHGFVNTNSYPCSFTFEQNMETRLRYSLAAKGIKFADCPECGELEYGQRHKCRADD